MRNKLNNVLRNFFGTLLILAVVQPATAKEKVNLDKPELQQVKPALLDVIGVLADQSTFKKNGLMLDELFSKYCTRKKQSKDEHSVDIQYVCDEVITGMKSVHFDSTEHIGLPNYLMTLDIEFEYSAFESIKRLVFKKLGDAHRKKKDYFGWIFKTDKFLNAHGNPVIEVSRDREENSASFSVGLEQGP